MLRLLKSLAANVFSLLLALVLAMLIWGVAVRDSDPDAFLQLVLPVQVLGRPNESVVSGLPDTVEIGVQGPESVINQLGPGDFVAELVLTDVPPGENTVPITIRHNQSEIELVWQVPQNTNVRVERLVTKEVPVHLDLEGSVARGYVIGEPFLDPPAITVTGPASRVEALAEVRVNVFLNNPQEDVVQRRRPIFYDQQGNPTSVNAPNLSVGVDQVVVTIPIDQLAGYAAKPIVVRWQGEPAQGYRLLDVSVEPDSVLVSGSPTQLDQLSRVRTEPIDITGLKQSVTMQVALDLPDGVELDEVQAVFVEIEIEPILTSSIIHKMPEIRALGRGLTMTEELEEVRVFLFGPLDKLDSLVDNDVRVTLDLFGLDEGTHNVEPDADVFVNGVEVRSIQPPQITINLTHTITATDELTATENLTRTTSSHRRPVVKQSGALPLLLSLLAVPALILPAGLLTWRQERKKL